MIHMLLTYCALKYIISEWAFHLKECTQNITFSTAFCTPNETIVVMKHTEEMKEKPPPTGSEVLEKLQCITMETILDILQFAMSCILLEGTIDALSNTHPKIPRISPHLSSLIKEAAVVTVGEAGDEHVHKK